MKGSGIPFGMGGLFCIICIGGGMPCTSSTAILSLWPG